MTPGNYVLTFVLVFKQSCCYTVLCPFSPVLASGSQISLLVSTALLLTVFL